MPCASTKVNNKGIINDFFHEVGGSGDRQSDRMLSVTPSSFYFVYVPTDLVSTYSNLEPIAFADAGNGCTSAVWDMGSFQFDNGLIPALTNREKSRSTGILVVPALAVEAQDYDSNDLSLEEIIPNCIPFWC